jgi:hypothetical protein
MEPTWLREALFSGQTANGFKFGTAMSLGWFWERVKGCRLVYRGESIETVDFEEVLAVAEPDAIEVELPGFLLYEPGRAYFYVVRCANECGLIERTLKAAVKAAIDDKGELRDARPNGVFGLAARQRQDGQIELVWHYSPIEQESDSKEMRIYSDGGSGEVNYQEPVAVVQYKGRRFYRYVIESPGNGWYRFAVRSIDAVGNEHGSTQTVELEVREKSVEAIEIIGVV